MEKETIDWQLNCTDNRKVEVRTKYAPYIVKDGKIWYVDELDDNKGYKSNVPTCIYYEEPTDFFDGYTLPEGTTEYGWVEVFQKMETRITKIMSKKKPLKPAGTLDPDELTEVMDNFIGEYVRMTLEEGDSWAMLIKPDHKLEYEDGTLSEVEDNAEYEFI